MPLKNLITYTQSLLVHSIYHKYSPPSLHNTWLTNNMRNETRELRNADDLYVPFARTEQVKKMSFFALPRVWNELHEQKFTPNPITFKIAIKSHFLSLTNPPLSKYTTAQGDLTYWAPYSPPCFLPQQSANLNFNVYWGPYQNSQSALNRPLISVNQTKSPGMKHSSKNLCIEVSWLKTEGSALYASWPLLTR